MSTSTIIAIIYIALTIITIPVTIILALRSKERDKTVAIVMTAVVYLFILSIVYSLSIFILTNLSHFNFIKNLTSLIGNEQIALTIIYIALIIIIIPVDIILALRSKELNKKVTRGMSAIVLLFILSMLILTNLSHFNFK